MMYVSTCERFEEWKDAIQAYCEENGLSYGKACKMVKCSNKNMLALAYDDPSVEYSEEDWEMMEDTPLPVVLWITRTESGPCFEQTEYTQQFLAP